MEQAELISAIAAKHASTGIHVRHAATLEQIALLEQRVGMKLPADFDTFYGLCNGFEVEVDQFQLLSLEEILEREGNIDNRRFYFAEYMSYSDMWAVRILGNDEYEIFCTKEPKVVSTDSFTNFLERFLCGGIFEEGGLYDLHAEASS